MSLKAVPLGNEIETVCCPHCGKERPASPGLYVCAACGGWFCAKEIEKA